MKKFTYTGDPNDTKEPIETKTAFGYTFEPGEAVEIDDSTEEGKRIVGKLEGNNHFTEEGKEPPVKRKPGPKSKKG